MQSSSGISQLTCLVNATHIVTRDLNTKLDPTVGASGFVQHYLQDGVHAWIGLASWELFMHAGFVSQINASSLDLILDEIVSTTLCSPMTSMVRVSATPFFLTDGVIIWRTKCHSDPWLRFIDGASGAFQRSRSAIWTLFKLLKQKCTMLGDNYVSQQTRARRGISGRARHANCFRLLTRSEVASRRQ